MHTSRKSKTSRTDRKRIIGAGILSLAVMGAQFLTPGAAEAQVTTEWRPPLTFEPVQIDKGPRFDREVPELGEPPTKPTPEDCIPIRCPREARIPDEPTGPEECHPQQCIPEDEPGDRPGDEPGDEPGDTPGDEPGDRPGDEPGDEPGDTPGDTPDEPGDRPVPTPDDSGTHWEVDPAVVAQPNFTG